MSLKAITDSVNNIVLFWIALTVLLIGIFKDVFWIGVALMIIWAINATLVYAQIRINSKKFEYRSRHRGNHDSSESDAFR